MSSQTSFWKRVSGVLRLNAGRANGNGALGTLSHEDHMHAGEAVVGDHDASATSLLPWVRRNRSIQQLDERYQRVLELLDSMRGHFRDQDRRAEELTAGVDRLGGTLQMLVETQQTQSTCIAAIAARADEAARHTAGLSAMLRELPASLQAQAEAVRAVARQMESSRASDVHLMEALQQFGHAANSLRDAENTQTEALRSLHDSQTQQKDSLESFVRSQTRLLLIITIIVGALGLGSIAALTVVVQMVFQS